MARQQLGKALSGGVIALCVILLLTPVTFGQFTIKRKTYTVSGSVGMPGVTMQGLPGAPTTNENGVYSVEINHGESLTITPVKLGYTFEPSQITYDKVTENKTEGNFTATLLEFKISGSVGMPGVTMQGLPGNVISAADGSYAATVKYGFSEMVTPTLEGFKFEPPHILYDQVKANQVKNYKPLPVTYFISGSVGAEGVVMKGLPGNPMSNKEGRYRAEVPYKWEGTVTPTKEGHEFTPVNQVYPPVTSDMPDELYISRVYTYTISGTTNLANVMLKGLPGDPFTDTTGYYEVQVEHGWEGTVTPFRAGWTFQPLSMNYPKVTSSRENQNYEPSVVQLTISGRAGVSGAVMQGLPGNPTTDPTGFFSAKVEYGWTGDITPIKEGYSFEPSSSVITSLANDMTNTNFKATPITYTIAGNVGLKGVVLRGLPGTTISDDTGAYSVQVPYKFSATVTPVLSGYTFDPPKNVYNEITSSLTNESYRYSIVQHIVSGRIIAESGSVEGIFIKTDNGGGTATTDAEGNYELSVNHGWRGTITPIKDGFTFTPPSRTLEQIFQERPNVTFIGKVKMMTITDSIIFPNGAEMEPIQDVLITAQPGGTTAVTGPDGKYRIQVPYGWTGELIPTKEGFDFTPSSIAFDVPVTSNLDKTAPEPVAPPVTDPVTTTPPVGTTPPAGTTPPVTTTPPAGTTPPVGTTPPAGTKPPVTTTPPIRTLTPEEEARRQELQREIDSITGGGSRDTTTSSILTLPPVTNPSSLTTLPPVVTTPNSAWGLLNVLALMEKQTGVKIRTDITVKPDPVAVGFNLTALTPANIPSALQMLLKDTDYMYQQEEDGYLVFRPISNQFFGDELPEALQNIGLDAGVMIVPDANVAGQVYGALDNVPLDVALESILAPTPFVVKRTPHYYMVTDRSVTSDAFWRAADTTHVRLNYATPKDVKEHLSSAFSQYVQANDDPNSRTISVMAPAEIRDRIVSDIKGYDTKPRHVILEARVVVMERSDLLNLGVEWGWPQLSAGSFRSNDSGGWLWGTSLGYSAGATFTESLLMALNLLEQNDQADIISKPVVTAQDGKMASISAMHEEYYILTPDIASEYYISTEMVTIISGTKLQITPHIGDNNDITLEIAAEVSESIPAGADTDLPVVTRRQSQNVTTIKDGGTVALAGLSETRQTLTEKKVPGLSSLPLVGELFKNKDSKQSTQEVAVFVTAHLVRERPNQVAGQETLTVSQNSSAPMTSSSPAFNDDFRRELENRMAGSSRQR